MKEIRRQKLSSFLQRELSEIIRREISLPENIFITVSRVEVSKDGSVARVFISGLKKEDVELAVDTLKRASGFIRRLIGKSLKTKVIPRFEFYPLPEVMLWEDFQEKKPQD